MQRTERIREQAIKRNLDAIVCSEPADVVSSTGYRSVLEQWGLTEPVAASIVYADPSKPDTLVIPEALVALEAITPTRASEIRVFDLATFCEVIGIQRPFPTRQRNWQRGRAHLWPESPWRPRTGDRQRYRRRSRRSRFAKGANRRG